MPAARLWSRPYPAYGAVRRCYLMFRWTRACPAGGLGERSRCYGVEPVSLSLKNSAFELAASESVSADVSVCASLGDGSGRTPGLDPVKCIDPERPEGVFISSLTIGTAGAGLRFLNID